jgi:putative SOS response-associated peptidase YedK
MQALVLRKEFLCHALSSKTTGRVGRVRPSAAGTASLVAISNCGVRKLITLREATLTTPDEVKTWMTAPADEALKLQRPLADGTLRIVARGVKEDLVGQTP